MHDEYVYQVHCGSHNVCICNSSVFQPATGYGMSIIILKDPSLGISSYKVHFVVIVVRG